VWIPDREPQTASFREFTGIYSADQEPGKNGCYELGRVIKERCFLIKVFSNSYR
jgi:hypothetical protein